MQVDSIGGIASILNPAQASSPVKQAEGSSFSDVLTSALQEAQTEGTKSDEQTLSLLSGDITDLHTATIQAQKAELTLDLAIQIRNKVVDAYNEVMRMSV